LVKIIADQKVEIAVYFDIFSDFAE